MTHQDLKHIRIEFHILQTFPVTCLNRDDVGSPKTAIVGGVTRARVSSQCWKRQVRLALREFGVKLGVRSKKTATLITEQCLKLGATQEQARQCAENMVGAVAGNMLLFISHAEAVVLADYAREQGFSTAKLKSKAFIQRVKKNVNSGIEALDIALFGRMVAKVADMNIEAAASFSHAISTHKVANEIDFFTALDDSHNEPGSAHIGGLEFNSATYYRYISLDLGQLAHTLDDGSVCTEQLKQAIAVFTKALFVAVPTARQTTQSGACPWEFAKVLVRKGQRLQVPFEEPIEASGSNRGYLSPSIAALKNYLTKKEMLAGSVFGKLGDYQWGEDETFNLDELILQLQSHVE